jgi:hypothetical protein
VQLFGLNYRGIMDPTDLEWYIAILEECKSLDINDFLHNVSPYVVNRTLPPQRAAPSNVSNSSRPATVPHRRLVETEFFGSGEMARERSSVPRQDTPNLGTLFGEGSREFNQLGPCRGRCIGIQLYSHGRESSILESRIPIPVSDRIGCSQRRAIP